ncbi:hypothetical protein QR680_012487 [Steinernema hermaphroditum]|uniref:Uncharacterized protein n=1 Tax=Steinernema hermaphroditum TaxID=289476 RepID=A0AA39I4H2_9BILA|nr:hypothetical protein QR680_012487 [Steinernema hermaphroditum]
MPFDGAVAGGGARGATLFDRLLSSFFASRIPPESESLVSSDRLRSSASRTARGGKRRKDLGAKMRVGDLKRAVEDVILRPDDNRLGDIGKRSTIAALDLCQYDSMGSPTSTPPTGTPRPSAAALNSCSCSGGDLASVPSGANDFGLPSAASPIPRSNSVQPPQLSMSSSLDTMVLRQSLSSRPSATFSRRSSRVLHHYNSKRKRSNSVSSCLNKGQQNSVSPTPVSLNPGLAIPSSANSLPPTARHTPFRFGDSVEDSHSAEAMHFENIEAEPDDHLPMLNGNGLPPQPPPPPIQRIPAGDPFAVYRNPATSTCDSDIEEQMDFE